MRVAKKMLFNTMILSLTALVMRTIGVSFNVFISNKIGASGVGLFQLIMSVYTFSITLATSGIRLTTTKLVAEELAVNRTGNHRLVVRKCLGYAMFFGFVSGVLLLFSAEWIGKKILGDERTIRSLYILSASLIPVACTAVFSGYFVAVRKVIKSASAQFLEQLLRMAIVIFGFSFVGSDSLETACVLIVTGGTIAEIFSFFYQWMMYRLEEKRKRRMEGKMPGLAFRMLSVALPLAVSGYARSLLSSAEHILIPKKMGEYGQSKESALSSYGLIHGMTLPILTFPSAFLGAFSSLLVPEVAECYVRKNTRRLNFIMTRVFQLALIFAVAVAGFFLFFPEEIAVSVYGSCETSRYLSCLAPLVVVMYLDDVVDAMLKGLDQQVSSMRYNLIDSFLGVVLVCVLIPKYGVGGYIAVIFITELVNAFLSINRLILVTDFKMNLTDWFLKPILSVSASSLVIKVLFGPLRTNAAITALMICLVLVMYYLFLRISGGLKREDIEFFAALFRKRK